MDILSSVCRYSDGLRLRVSCSESDLRHRMAARRGPVPSSSSKGLWLRDCSPETSQGPAFGNRDALKLCEAAATCFWRLLFFFWKATSNTLGCGAWAHFVLQQQGAKAGQERAFGPSSLYVQKQGSQAGTYSVRQQQGAKALRGQPRNEPGASLDLVFSMCR